MNQHKHYNLAYRAHSGTSFTPDKRALQAVAEFDADIANLEEKGIDKISIAKYETLWVNAMIAKSRCLSSMITGPANFPIARNEKANNAERKASDKCLAFYNKLINEADKEAFYKANPEARPIMAGDNDALERLEAKVEKLKALQEEMKRANKAECGTYASYQLTNNRAEIKRLEQRIEEIKQRKESTTKEMEVSGVKVLENTDLMRLQLFFNGKPAPDIIKTLKSNGFKWAPSQSAWQRQLTNNAIYSFNHFVLPALKSI